MRQVSRSDQPPHSPFLHRLDRIFGEINAVLVAVVIGLGVLDFTCFVALRALATTEATRAQWVTQSPVPAPAAPVPVAVDRAPW